MRQVIYSSQKKDSFSTEMILEMLDKAQSNNNSRGIHGLLVYRNGYFLQVFEEPKEVVGHLKEKIFSDKRHHNIVTLADRETKQLDYAPWDMAYCPESQYKEILGSSDKNLIDLSLEECEKLLRDFNKYLIKVSDL